MGSDDRVIIKGLLLVSSQEPVLVEDGTAIVSCSASVLEPVAGTSETRVTHGVHISSLELVTLSSN